MWADNKMGWFLSDLLVKGVQIISGFLALIHVLSLYCSLNQVPTEYVCIAIYPSFFIFRL